MKYQHSPHKHVVELAHQCGCTTPAHSAMRKDKHRGKLRCPVARWTKRASFFGWLSLRGTLPRKEKGKKGGIHRATGKTRGMPKTAAEVPSCAKAQFMHTAYWWNGLLSLSELDATQLLVGSCSRDKPYQQQAIKWFRMISRAMPIMRLQYLAIVWRQVSPLLQS